MTVNNKATGADQVLALPEWSDCESAVDEKMATPLQEFIYEYEPGNNDKEWRARLTAALAQARKEGAQQTWKDAADYVGRQWLAAYPVEVFPEPPPPPAPATRDAVSAAMGRHMAEKLIEHFQAVAERGTNE